MGDASERAARAQERLAAQRAEAKSNPEYGQTFKGPASADDKKARRKQILSTIGAWRRRGRPLAPFSGGTPARGACLTAVLSVSSLNAAGPQSAAAPVRGRGRGLAPRACGGRAQARTCWWRRLTSRSASRYVPGALTLNQIIGRLAASGAVPALHARPPAPRSCARRWPAPPQMAHGAPHAANGRLQQSARAARRRPSRSWCARSPCWTASARRWIRALTSARSRRPTRASCCWRAARRSPSCAASSASGWPCRRVPGSGRWMRVALRRPRQAHRQGTSGQHMDRL